ncbi:hypothetical protein [uncultured Planococcus sp.]|uniref:hypothetical protein n=1 Tax=uncultured Planococcus sp. TaxID=337815 RepID=UPI002615CC6C|nr:hypothetical protein [uncultured Planococcus sp.]
MAKNDFSKDTNPQSSHNRRQREEFESIDQESREDGDKMQKKGAHSNTGVGDEQNPIGESEEK